MVCLSGQQQVPKHMNNNMLMHLKQCPGDILSQKGYLSACVFTYKNIYEEYVHIPTCT